MSMSRYTTRELTKALEQWGFVEDSQRSSKHLAYRHLGSQQIVQMSWGPTSLVNYRALRKAVRVSDAASIEELMRGPHKVRIQHEQPVLPDLTEMLSAAEPDKEHDTVNTTPVTKTALAQAESVISSPTTLVREALSITPDTRLTARDIQDLTGLNNKQVHNAIGRQVSLGFAVNDNGYYRLTEAARANAPAPTPSTRTQAMSPDKPHYKGLGRHQRSVLDLMEAHPNHDWNLSEFKSHLEHTNTNVLNQALRALRDKGLVTEVRAGVWRLAFSAVTTVKPPQPPVEAEEHLDLDAFSPTTLPVPETVTQQAPQPSEPDVIEAEIVETRKPMRGDTPRTGKYADRTGCAEDVFDLLQDGVARSTREVCALVDHPYDSVQAALVNLAYTNRISRIERGVYARLDRGLAMNEPSGMMTSAEARTVAHVEWTTIETQDDGSVVLRGPDGHLYLARRAKVTFE